MKNSYSKYTFIKISHSYIVADIAPHVTVNTENGPASIELGHPVIERLLTTLVAFYECHN